MNKRTFQVKTKVVYEQDFDNQDNYYDFITLLKYDGWDVVMEERSYGRTFTLLIFHDAQERE